MERLPLERRRLRLALLTLALGCVCAWAQLPEIDATTPEGAILQRIGMGQNDAEKLTAIDEFLGKFPDHDAAEWVLSQQLTILENQKENAKVIATAERLVAKDPSSVRGAFAAMKAAEALDDSAAVLKWAAATHEACQATLAKQMPEDADEANWKAQQDYARQVDKLSEYGYAGLAVKASDAAAIDSYVEALRKQNPESEYLTPMIEREFLVARAANNKDLAMKAGEALAAGGYKNPDVLIFLAGAYLETKKNQEKIPEYTEAALAAIEAAPKPENVSQEEFEKNQKLNQGIAYWIQGLYHANGNRWAQANKSLHAALPHIAGNSSMQSAAYFYLGLANFEIGKRSKDHKEILDAVKFTELCTKMAGPYQAQAKKNLVAIRGQFRF